MAHRWDVGYLVGMTERMLVSLLDLRCFERVAELALLKGSQDFERTVAWWGGASAQVQRKLAAEGYSPPVQRLLAKDTLPPPAAGQKRKSF